MTKRETFEETTDFSAEACIQILEDMAGSHFEERSELLTSGVASSAVDSLYPLDFVDFVDAVGELLAASGTDHLGPSSMSRSKWIRLIELSDQVCDSFGPTSDPFELEWDKNDGMDGDLYPILTNVHVALKIWHSNNRAANYAYYYGRSLLAAHWLLRRTEAIKRNREDAKELCSWVVNRLLPRKVASAV